MDFKIYNADNAPEKSKELLNAVKGKLGLIPNLMGTMAESPAVLESYLNLDEALGNTDFSPKEQQLAILAISYENKCHYCMAAHSTIARGQLGIDDEIVDAVRSGEEIEDEKLNALITFARKVTNKRGFVSDDEVNAFLDAGYTKRHVLELILITSMKTLSNYINHIAVTPVDKPFEAEKLEFEKAEV